MNTDQTITVEHIWCAHCAQPYTVPEQYVGCPVCAGQYCNPPDTCVEVQATETITVDEWRRRILAGCMSDPVVAA